MKERVRMQLLLATVALVYGDSLWNGFTRDDDMYIVSNPQVTRPSLAGLFAPHRFSAVVRPVTFGTFALNWAAEGAHPFGYHLVNLLLHAAATCLLYLLLRNILEAVLPQGKTVAFVAALLFAVHPINSEAVASISGRAELLAAGFLFAGCLLHLSDREIPALVCFALAVLSKESAVVFLPVALLCDYARGQWKPLLRYARMAGVTALYLAGFWELKGRHFGLAEISALDNPLASLPAKWRVLNALGVAWRYVGLQLYPRTLSCDYSFNQIPVYLDWRHTLPAAVAALAAVGAWIWAVRKHRAGLVLAGGIYLAGFATTANILMPVGTVMGERLAYLPSAGFCLLAALFGAWLAGDEQSGSRRRTLAVAALVAVVAALGARSIVRNLDWQNDLTLASAAVRAVPRSARMHATLGGAYLNTGQFDLARKELQIAVEINPEYPDALEAYGVLESRMGDYQTAGWMLEKALYTSSRSKLNYDYMAVNLAALYIQTDHMDGAMDLLNREIAESPSYGRAWSNRAVVHYKLGELSAAGSDAEMALSIEPGNTQAQNLMRLLSGGAPQASSQ